MYKRQLSFHVEEGEIVALIGANGAGKTTTLQTISGILQAKSGSVNFQGKEITSVPGNQIVKLGMSHVPEGRRMFSNLTVYENLMMGAYTRKDKKQIAETLEKVYERFPRLQERTRQLAGTLSGGEQQMLAMGRALMAQPRIILMDEPSMGLSPLFVNEIFNIITEVNKQGVTILLVEQNAKKALSIANRAYVLETGRIVNEGDAHALLDDESIDVYKRQVDDHIGTVHFHISPHLIHIGDIHLIPVRQKHIQLRSIQHPCKCAAHLSLGPCNPNPFML